MSNKTRITPVEETWEKASPPAQYLENYMSFTIALLYQPLLCQISAYNVH